jgi:hypothetical protein
LLISVERLYLSNNILCLNVSKGIVMAYNKECYSCRRFGNCSGAGMRPVKDKDRCPWIEPYPEEEEADATAE